MNHGLQRIKSGELPLSNARFVPPPAPEVLPAMSDLEKFPHDDPEPTPLLIKAALAHVQFETIHPFLDGKQQPLLYLSLYFKQNRDAYYDHLQRVRTEGAWEDWLAFFLEGVIAVASGRLVERDREAIHGLGRGAASALRVHELAGRRVVPTATSTSARLGLSAPTVNAAFTRLEEAGILREVTGRRRGRVFVYAAYLELLQVEQ
jgi:Fic family protein